MNANHPTAHASDGLIIVRGFPEALRPAAAAVYDEAFGAKLGLAIPNQAARLAVLSAAFDPGHCLVALRGGQLLGVAGFQSPRGALVSGISLRLLRARLGLAGALRAKAVLSLFRRRVRPGELLMDGLAVSLAARGSGVGTRLLEQLKRLAAEEGYRAIRLDVIDTNTGALRLYLRLGFEPTSTTRFAWLRWFLGFSAATTLKFRLPNRS
jgi:ribosomal protein S18 acetylase RimI-like enzyme